MPIVRTLTAGVVAVVIALGAIGMACGSSSTTTTGGDSSPFGNTPGDASLFQCVPACTVAAAGYVLGDPRWCAASFTCGGVVHLVTCPDGSTCECSVGDSGLTPVAHDQAFCGGDEDASTCDRLSTAFNAANAACGWDL